MDSYFNNFPLGEEIWKKKYKYKNDNTIDDTWKRVSNAIGQTQNEKDSFYEILSGGYFVPGGRITNGAGTEHNYLMNCSVLDIEDSLDGIYETVKKAAKMFKCNYGVGYSFHKLRPKNAILSKGGKSSGVVSFMKVFDASCAVIQSGGESRRGAQIASLLISHPDIEEFIDAKHKDGDLTNFNISVGITKEFIDAVENDLDFNLVFDGVIYKTVKAKHLWNKLCLAGYKHNDPGILNLHEANKCNNLYYLKDFFATNPCLHPDSLIETINGRIKIKDIIEPTMVYTMLDNGSLGIKRASASWISKKDAKTLIIETNNGKKLRCTENHKIFLHDKGWVEAKDIKKGDRIVQLNRLRRGSCYSGIKLTSEDRYAYQMEHRFIANAIYGITDNDDVHHIDSNTYNNCISNLKILTHSEHSRYTALYENPQTHQVRDSNGKFIKTVKKHKQIIDMPEDLRSNMKNNYSNCVISITEGDIIDVYDMTVEDTHNFIADFSVVHNCGEIFLFQDEVCCLGNINTTKFVKNPFTKEVSFDYENFKKTVSIAVKFLDNVIDISDYPFNEIKTTVQSNRRLGLNVVGGLGSTLAMMKLPYDSNEAIEFGKELQQLGTIIAYKTSIELSKEKGPFSTLDIPKYLNGNFIKKLPENIRNEISQYGIRNCALTTIPPMGTGSLLIGNISSGMEPIFSLEYERKVRQDDNSFKTELVDDYSWRLYKSLGKPDGKHPIYFKTAREINPYKHIDMQAGLQEFVCNSISKTINIQQEFTLEEYEKLLWYAIKNGCKGVTTFREGTREGILSTKNEKSKTEIKKDQQEFFSMWSGHDGDKVFDEVELPEEYPCKGFILKSENKKFYLHVAFKDKNKTKPFALFVHTNNKESNIVTYTALEKLEELAKEQGIPEEHITKNKNKCIDQNNINKLARTISLLLRHNVKINLIVNLLDSIKEIPVSSFIFRIKKFLSKYINETINEKCPDCGSVLKYQSGCVECSQGCGFSKC